MRKEFNVLTISAGGSDVQPKTRFIWTIQLVPQAIIPSIRHRPDIPAKDLDGLDIASIAVQVRYTYITPSARWLANREPCSVLSQADHETYLVFSLGLGALPIACVVSLYSPPRLYLEALSHHIDYSIASRHLAWSTYERHHATPISAPHLAHR